MARTNRSLGRRLWDVIERYHLGDLPSDIVAAMAIIAQRAELSPAPIPMLLWCPECGTRHIDQGEFAEKRHHTHACQSCGHVWRPAIHDTVGVKFLPGFKDSI